MGHLYHSRGKMALDEAISVRVVWMVTQRIGDCGLGRRLRWLCNYHREIVLL